MSNAASSPVLAVRNLEAWYGESHILHGIDFDVQPGEVVTLLGRNGAGKTTTLKSVMGIIGKRTGSVLFEGKDIVRMPSEKIARLGVAFCPEERGIFASLDVKENLLLPPIIRSGGMSLNQIFELFPNLKERLDNRVHYAAADVVAYSPVSGPRAGDGGGLTVGELCSATVSLSDNTAANVLMARHGGPAGFLAMMGTKNNAT